MINLTFYGHACFGVDTGSARLLIDPFLTGNPLAPVAAADVDADYVLVTHGHHDHAGDAAAIAGRTGARIVTTVEVGQALFSGCDTVAGNIGGTLRLPFGGVKLVTAIHGSGVPGGLACGFVIEADGKTVYHMGDTALTRDFELLRNDDHPIDALLIPIGGHYTMGPDDALRAVEMIRPRLVIPMHFGTFAEIDEDPAAFCAAVEKTGAAARVLRPGETIAV